MFELFELVLLLIGIPFGLAWAARKIGHIKNAFLSVLAVVAAAGIPSIWIFYETQQADSITRAASVFVTPFLFLFALVPAAVGYFVARPAEPPK